MLPESYLPRKGITNWRIFNPQQSTTTTNGWVTWSRPNGISWIYAMIIASGGGGGKGAGGAATVASGGGGSGGMSRLLIPAWCLPDLLYIRPGTGGAGSTTSANGTIGTQSY